MTNDDICPEPGEHAPLPSADLVALTCHPSLAELRGRGWELDRLPTAATGRTFLLALVACFAGDGTDGAAFICTWSVLTVMITALTLGTGDVAMARLTLNVARYGMLAAIVLSTALTLTFGTASTGATGGPTDAPVTTGDHGIRFVPGGYGLIPRP
jgi:hypothetical protein